MDLFLELIELKAKIMDYIIFIMINDVLTDGGDIKIVRQSLSYS